MTDAVALTTALVLGFIHALELDHMVAVTAFVSGRPTLAGAARFGFRWGLGHSIAVLLAGGLLLATGLRWSESWDRAGETLVGVMLIGIGLWSLRATRNLHLHPPGEHGDHAHFHTHRTSPGPTEGDGRSDAHRHPGPVGDSHAHMHAHAHGRSRGITAVGLMHGLAGTSAVVALVPVTMVSQPGVGIGYLVAFGIGVTMAMTLFALVTAVAMRQAAARSIQLGRQVANLVGVLGIAVGVWWIWRASTGG